MAFCEQENNHYVIGVAGNERLTRRIQPELAAAEADSLRRNRPARRFKDFSHSTRESWSRARRVVAKAEHLPGKANPRFVVTSLEETIASSRTVSVRRVAIAMDSHHPFQTEFARVHASFPT